MSLVAQGRVLNIEGAGTWHSLSLHRRQLMNRVGFALIRRLPSNNLLVLRLHCRLFSCSIIARNENAFLS